MPTPRSVLVRSVALRCALHQSLRACRWDNNGNIHDHHLQPTMALLLHQSPIRMIIEVYMGLDMLISADTSGMLAMWESATCHCKLSKNIPELREAVSVLASQLSGSGATCCSLSTRISLLLHLLSSSVNSLNHLLHHSAQPSCIFLRIANCQHARQTKYLAHLRLCTC